MKKAILKSVVVCAIALFTISCSNDGEQGPPGKDGIDGNANVVGSTSITTTSSNWTSYYGGSLWIANLTGATSITQSIVDKGMVCVYRKYTSNGTTQWSPLPDTNTNINVSFDYGVGIINFYAQSTNGASIPNPGAMTFRFVAVSPTNKMANKNVNWRDYEQVKKTLKIND